MRLSCEYKTNKIPMAYKMMFVSLIKEALKRVNEDYYRRLYEFGDKNNKQMKNFCFAVSLKEYQLDGEVIHIKDRIVLNISTPDYEFGINVYNGLLNLNKFEYKDFKLDKIKINLQKEKFVSGSEALFRTMSPICIKDRNNNFLNPKDENFVEELNYIANQSFKNCRGYGLKEALRFSEEGCMKKVVVKEEIRAFKEATNKKTFYVNAYSGVFKLIGDVEDLNLIYQNGLGFRRSQGFGMLELVQVNGGE